MAEQLNQKKLLPSEEMRWKKYYSEGYEEILAQEFAKETLWKFIERGILNDGNRHGVKQFVY